MKPLPHRSPLMQTHWSRCGGIVCAALLSAACGGSNSAKGATTTSTANAPPELRVLAEHGLEPEYTFDQALPDCPMQVPETDLTSMPVDGGLALAFTTPRSAEEVRFRARKLANEYTQGRVRHVPSTRAEVIEIPGGARVEVRAIYIADVPRVRAHLRWRAAKMQETGSCPMMRQARLGQKGMP